MADMSPQCPVCSFDLLGEIVQCQIALHNDRDFTGTNSVTVYEYECPQCREWFKSNELDRLKQRVWPVDMGINDN